MAASDTLYDTIYSRPARARGLKHFAALPSGSPRTSRPARARGLKLYDLLRQWQQFVRAPRGRVD